MRIGIAKIMQETSTFSTQPTDLEAIHAQGVVRGREVLERATMWDEFVDGFLQVASAFEPVGITKVTAMPAGKLTAEAQQAIMEWFAEDLRRALPLDGLLLSLHGAFAGDLEPDVDGLIIQRAREIVGAHVPIGVSLDLHANLTRRMVEHADIIDVMHTHPHVDMSVIGARVARTLVATIQGQVRPLIRAVKIPLITPAETQISAEPPLAELMELTRRQEEHAPVLHSAMCAVQPWMDIPEMGWCSVVTTDADAPTGERLARELAAMAWEQRAQYTRPCPSHVEALDAAFATPERPVVISDLADLMTGGGTGDSTWYLRELLARAPGLPCYLTMVDPQAVHHLAAAGEGAQVTLALGGKQDHIHSSPVEVSGTVLRIIPVTPGRELPASIGLTVTFQVGEVYIVIFERLGPGDDPVLYSGAGLDPAAAKILISKSVVDFREGFKDIAKVFLLGEAPGLAPANLLSLEWRHVPRPIVPLDPEMAWDSATGTLYSSGNR